MPTIETLFYHGTLYTWHHEKQNEYRHITIYDAVLAVEDDKSVMVVQDMFFPERIKHIGLAPCGIIVVITDAERGSYHHSVARK